MNKILNIGKKLIILVLALLFSLSLKFQTFEQENTKPDLFDLSQMTVANPVPPASDDPPSLTGEKAIAFLKESGQYESLGAAFNAALYKVNLSEENVTAVNFANKMHGTFTPKGLLLESEVENAKWQSRWRLQNLGYGDDQLTVGDSEVQTNGNRVTINHQISTRNESKIIEEWFKNTPVGLEHGFTLTERLSESVGNLRLTIAIEGDLTAKADGDGQNLKLVNKQGKAVLNYEKLKVFDADGAEIPARMSTANGTLMLDVEDAAAKYPLVIDPIFSTAAKLFDSNGMAGDRMGSSVAISGDFAVIGAPDNDFLGAPSSGTAFIFKRGTNGLWVFRLGIGGLPQPLSRWGSSVAISGDTMVYSAPFYDNTFEDDGRVCVWELFLGDGTCFGAEDAAANDHFGKSIAISGDTIIVGANENDINGNTNQGSAYVFVRNGTHSWTQQAKLFDIGGEADDHFGSAVAIAGNTVIVGAPFQDIGGNPNQGSAHIFTRSGTTWSHQQKLTASDGTVPDAFGQSVGISTGFLNSATVIIGVPHDDIGANQDQGSAYVFTRSGTAWSFQQKLTASDGERFDQFGNNVGISGGMAIVGSPLDNHGGINDTGSAYVFQRIGGTTWIEKQKLFAFDGAAGEEFGSSVAISSSSAVVGAPRDVINNNFNQGSAYIFRLASTAFDFDNDELTDLGIFRPSAGEWWINRSSTAQTFVAQFGQNSDRIAPADFTGDGKTDIAFWRPGTGFWFILRSEDSSFFSFPFGTAGDIPAPADFDGDGKADAAVFRPSNSTWYVSNSGGGTTIQQFGASGDVPVANDYDGDGKADLAIFRPNAPNGAEWWIYKSSNNQVFATQFGASNDKAVPADYTGDGKVDMAFFRPSNGNWFILRSENLSFYSFPFGANGDTPTPGDYDGDSKFDAAVFRPSNSTWYVNKSSGGTLIQQFGANGDVPLPAAYIP